VHTHRLNLRRLLPLPTASRAVRHLVLDGIAVIKHANAVKHVTIVVVVVILIAVDIVVDLVVDGVTLSRLDGARDWCAIACARCNCVACRRRRILREVTNTALADTTLTHHTSRASIRCRALRHTIARRRLWYAAAHVIQRSDATSSRT
jgi:hypothetical protein